MMRTLAICAALLWAVPAKASNESEVAVRLTEFLEKVDDPAMHERFWADDLIYVSAAGVKKTKAEILASMREEKPKAGEPKTWFTAEDVQLRSPADSVVVLNFRLVQHVGDKTNYFRNSGTFVRRRGQWQAVSWQATREEKK